MTAPREHLERLRSLVGLFKTESGDVVIGKMIPEFAALIVQLSDELDAAQRKVVRLTWALFWLTGVLLVIGIVQLVVTISPPLLQPAQSTIQQEKGASQSQQK
jgi:hypothetical protein